MMACEHPSAEGFFDASCMLTQRSVISALWPFVRESSEEGVPPKLED